MFGLFKRKNININERLHNIANEIYASFEFDMEKVVYKLDDKAEISQAFGVVRNNQFHVSIGIKDYLDTNEIDEVHTIYFRNTLFHEFVHAESWVKNSKLLKESFELNKLTFAYWAYKLLDEYRAYSRANVKYKQDPKFLKRSENEVVFAFEHYCNKLTFRNGKPHATVFTDSYYDLGAAFIAHRFVNPDFPTISDKHYTRFIEMYFGHFKQACDDNINEYKEYEELSKRLVEDFKILFSFVQKRNRNISFEYFVENSQMK